MQKKTQKMIAENLEETFQNVDMSPAIKTDPLSRETDDLSPSLQNEYQNMVSKNDRNIYSD